MNEKGFESVGLIKEERRRKKKKKKEEERRRRKKKKKKEEEEEEMAPGAHLYAIRERIKIGKPSARIIEYTPTKLSAVGSSEVGKN